ncbi:unnamed protein product [Meganyctiphanes norvegica]|uniref:Uncharacterized protein n=1 Tax=Meganyctiphanes norvegica TaxID=48144 RepID=A0AAV2Q845_MEGNR
MKEAVKIGILVCDRVQLQKKFDFCNIRFPNNSIVWTNTCNLIIETEILISKINQISYIFLEPADTRSVLLLNHLFNVIYGFFKSQGSKVNNSTVPNNDSIGGDFP